MTIDVVSLHQTVAWNKVGQRRAGFSRFSSSSSSLFQEQRFTRVQKDMKTHTKRNT